MTDYAKIIDHPNLIRDMRTGAVLNTDTVAVRRHEKRIADLQKEQARDHEINCLRKEMSEIKALICQLSTHLIK